MEVSILSIVLGGLAFWAVGAIWYSFLFGKIWQREVGFSDEDLKGSNMPLIFGLSFVLMVLMSYALSFIIGAHPVEERTFVHGMFHGALAGALFGATTIGINYLYQRKSIKLYLIDALYIIVGLALSGGVMAAMN